MSIALPIAVFLSSFSHGFTRATQACYLSDTGVAYDTVLVYVFFNGNRWYTSLLRQGQEVGLRGMCLLCGKEKCVHLEKKKVPVGETREHSRVLSMVIADGASWPKCVSCLLPCMVDMGGNGKGGVERAAEAGTRSQ